MIPADVRFESRNGKWYAVDNDGAVALRVDGKWIDAFGGIFTDAEVADLDSRLRAHVVTLANECGRSSRRGGAPMLSVDAARADLIRWHEWNDPNGSYLDPIVSYDDGSGMCDAGWTVNVVEEANVGFGANEVKAREYAREMTQPIEDLWDLLTSTMVDA